MGRPLGVSTDPLLPTAPRAAGPAPASIAAGARLGRFIVAERLGAGGMGVVHVGYDPELDRGVAIKVVRADHAGSDRARARLVREAQALARLSHPNVIAIHDVGTVGDQVFLAMELVRGETLRAWRQAAPRPWREVVAMLAQVARGLAAAHRAGLVHGDVKPDNVLVASDGRAVVVDFGLARAEVDDRAEPAAHGERAGTPAYMAPEQARGRPIDGRADQYGFCVTLHEALCGSLPVAGGGRPRGAGPAWLWRIIRRGLATDAAQRYASMDHLLAALVATPQRRRRIAAGVGAIALAAAAGFAVDTGRAPAAATSRCPDAEAQLAAVWNPAVRGRLQATFAHAGGEAGLGVWRRVAPMVDGYGARLVAMRHQACLASATPGERVSGLSELRAACLDRRFGELAAQLELFGRADAVIVQHALDASATLADLDGCANVRGLRAVTPPPTGLLGRLMLPALHGQLASVRALEHAGHVADGLAAATAAVAAARRFGYAPVLAEALYRYALLQARGDARVAAERSLSEATALATASGHDELAAEAWMERAWLVSRDPRRVVEADDAIRQASAWLDRIDAGDRQRAKLLNQRGATRMAVGDLVGAQADFAEALAVAQRPPAPDDSAIAAYANNAANVARRQGEFAAADTLLDVAIAAAERAWGDAHPDLAALLSNRARVRLHLGRLADALTIARRALALKARVLGPDHASNAATLETIGLVQHQQGRLPGATATLRAACALAERAAGSDDPQVASCLMALGDLLAERGRFAAAAAALQRSVRIREAAFGPDHPDVADSLRGLGDLMLRQRRPAAALAHYQRVLAIRERAFGPTHPFVAAALLGVAQAELAADGAPAAIVALERALPILAFPRARLQLPWARFLLAQASWSARHDRRQAEALAAAAHADAVQQADTAITKEIETWLSERRWNRPTRTR